jgi:hypothetical protein
MSTEVVIETFLRDPLHRGNTTEGVIPAIAAASSEALILGSVAAKACDRDREICPVRVVVPGGVRYPAQRCISAERPPLSLASGINIDRNPGGGLGHEFNQARERVADPVSRPAN